MNLSFMGSPFFASFFNALNAQFLSLWLNITYPCQQDIFLIGKKSIQLNYLIHNLAQAVCQVS